MPLGSCQTPEELLKDPHARIQTLSEIGAAVEIDDNIPPRRYFRSGLEMMRMANVYYEEKNLENAFILYSKFITLFLEKLPRHQDYQLVSANDRKNMKKKIKEIFPKAEKIKELLRERYNQETLLWQQQKKIETAKQAQEREEQNRKQNEQRELKRYEHEKEMRLSEQREKQLKQVIGGNDAQNNTQAVNIDWPSVPEFDGSSCSSDGTATTASISIGASDYGTVPEISIATPNVDRTTKPPSLLSHTATQPELHNVVVPLSLMSKFLKLSQLNTEKAIETCGVLAGRLAHNVFTITHLLIPHQHGTSDSCTTENEEELFEYQDQHDLLTLGWIHTHPTQTSFMSSVDLHTHCSYQLMMPEAIAIVCAPKFNETGIFTLTQDFGLDYIAKCQLSGFHPHPKEPPLFETCTHVITDGTMPVVVIDLRNT